MNDIIPGLLDDEPRAPRSDSDWFDLDVAVADLFSPHAPIDEEDLFSGRTDLLVRIVDLVFQRGLHAILYGERGVGKTSLTYIMNDKVFRGSRSTKLVRRQCTADHTFELIWKNVFDEFTTEGGDSAASLIGDDPTAYDIVKLFEDLPKEWRPVIVIDEFDRVRDKGTIVKMADTIKYLADTSSQATIIIVGVANSVADLFGGHHSIHRNLQQIKMPRMSEGELDKILTDRAQIVGMTVPEGIRDQIVKYSQGLPGYTHLLGQAAFRSAVRRRSLTVEMTDLALAMKKCAAECDETVREAYAKAVRSTQGSSLYKQALFACALAETDDKGYFRASNVKKPFSQILGREVEVFNFKEHLKQFCKPSRGPALIKVGGRGNAEYRFHDALLRPYVIIKGFSDDLFARTEPTVSAPPSEQFPTGA